MPTVAVVLPSSTYRAADFVRAAESLGVDLVVASENPPPFDMGDRYLQIDCDDPEAAANRLADLGMSVGLDGVVAADDQGVMVAAHASDLLGLAGNPPDAAAATRDKLEMRRRLANAEVDQPRHVALAPGESAANAVRSLGGPVVVKPRDRSASQGVIRVDDPEEADLVAERIRGIVGSDATLLVEELMPGAEIAIEGLVEEGDLTVLAVFDKPDTGTGPYFPETIFVTPSRLGGEALEEAERTASAAVRSLGLKSGPVHVELKVEGSRARIIEVAARSIGGLCSRSLTFGLMGTSLETLILRNAMGMGRERLKREPSASGVLMIPTPEGGVLASVRGESETRAIPGITGMDFTIRPGEEVVPPPEGERYLGFVYARAGTPEEVESALRRAMSELQVQLEG
jgi:biotin carboxylase